MHNDAPLPKHYLLVTSTGVLHTYPSREECNLDAVQTRFRKQGGLVELKAHPKFRKMCGHCAIKVMPNPDLPAEGAGDGEG